MNWQEFSTAVHHRIPLIVVVVDNGIYGTIRMHQERTFPGRVAATTLTSPDFAALARAFGGHGETVETTAAFAPAFERALASGPPAILHCKLDRDRKSTRLHSRPQCAARTPAFAGQHKLYHSHATSKH